MSGVDFGDVAGLHELAAVYHKARAEFEGAAHALDHQVTALTGDAWDGETARAFQAAWDKDSKSAYALSEMMGRVAGTVERLAEALGRAKRDYEHTVATAAEHGVPVVLPGQEASVCLTPQAQQLSDELSAAATAAVKLAETAREQATAELEPVFAMLDPTHAVMRPGRGEPKELLGLKDWVKLGAALADLYAVPAVAGTIQQARVAKLAAEYVKAKRDYSLAGGKAAKRSLYRELRAAKKDALRHLRDARGKLAEVEVLADKLPGSRAAATDLAEAARWVGKDISELKIIRGAPLVDVAATAYNVYDDVHNHGWSPVHAVAADGAATLAGMGAGAAVLAIAPEAAPAIAVAGVGFAAGYEASEAVDALTHDAHWGANIDKYGVIGGIGHSFEDAGKAFAHNNAEMGHKIWNAGEHYAKKLWHGVFG